MFSLGLHAVPQSRLIERLQSTPTPRDLPISRVVSGSTFTVVARPDIVRNVYKGAGGHYLWELRGGGS